MLNTQLQLQNVWSLEAIYDKEIMINIHINSRTDFLISLQAARHHLHLNTRETTLSRVSDG